MLTWFWLCPQVLMVRFCSLFDPKERTVTFLNGQTYSLASLRALGMGTLLDAMFEFSEKLGSMGLEPDEMALFMAVVLVSAGMLISIQCMYFISMYTYKTPYAHISPSLILISTFSFQIAPASWTCQQWSSCRKI